MLLAITGSSRGNSTRKCLLVRRWSVARRHRNVEQAKIDSQLRAMVREMSDHRATHHVRPRLLQHDLLPDAQRPRRSRVLPCHLLDKTSQLSTHRLEDLQPLGVVRRTWLSSACGAVKFVLRQHQYSETG